MTNLDCILKNRDITLPTKVCLVKAMVFLVVMYGCESWTIKKAERRRIDVLNCGVGEDSWESLDYKEIQPVHSKGNQSWVFTGRTDAEAETPILWSPDAKNWLIWNDPDAGKIEGRRRRERQRMRWLASPTRWTWVWANSGSWWWTGKPGVLQSMGSQRVGHDWVNNSVSVCYLLGFWMRLEIGKEYIGLWVQAALRLASRLYIMK